MDRKPSEAAFCFPPFKRRRWTSIIQFDVCRSSWTWPRWSQRWCLEWPLTRNSSLTAFWAWWPISFPSPTTTKVHGTCTSARWVSAAVPDASSPWARGLTLLVYWISHRIIRKMSLKHYLFTFLQVAIWLCSRILILQKQMLFGLKICNMCLPIGDTGEKTHIHPPKENQTKIKNH